MENRPVALITGCSTGIGFEASLTLARKGFFSFRHHAKSEKSGGFEESG